jgi:hypothetical protein
MLQFKGLIFNIYLVFILIWPRRTKLIANPQLMENIAVKPAINESFNHNKLRSLIRITTIKLILYIIFDFELLKNKNNSSLTIMDGKYKITNLKLIMEIYILKLAIIIINGQNHGIWSINQIGSYKTEMILILLTNI